MHCHLWLACFCVYSERDFCDPKWKSMLSFYLADFLFSWYFPSRVKHCCIPNCDKSINVSKLLHKAAFHLNNRLEKCVISSLSFWSSTIYVTSSGNPLCSPDASAKPAFPGPTARATRSTSRAPATHGLSSWPPATPLTWASTSLPCRRRRWWCTTDRWPSPHIAFRVSGVAWREGVQLEMGRCGGWWFEREVKESVVKMMGHLLGGRGHNGISLLCFCKS